MAQNKRFKSIELPKDKFFDCKHGYIYTIPEFAIFQAMCKKTKDFCNSEKCKLFEEKGNKG